MTQQETIMDLVRANNGILTTARAVENGISRGVLGYMVKQGTLLRASRGVYTLPDVWDDDFLNLQTRFKRGVFSHETALFLWNLTDRTPTAYHMTFPTNYNLSNPRLDGVCCAQVKPDLYIIGIETVKTPAGNAVNCYSAERTLCDILRPYHATDIQLVTEAFKCYTSSNQKNIPLLSEYARKFGVAKKIRPYLEVLL